MMTQLTVVRCDKEGCKEEFSGPSYWDTFSAAMASGWEHNVYLGGHTEQRCPRHRVRKPT